jgi:hypothetical protein
VNLIGEVASCAKRGRAAAAHPAVAQVYDVDEADGVIFIAMELIELTSALRDPYIAFQVATAKPPTKLAHLYHSLDYYSVQRVKRS